MSRASKSIVLVGMMGAGKSSVGRALQRRTGFACIETDEIVSTKFGISIQKIFSEFGEERFREAETEALRELPAGQEAIIVTGGGIVLREENIDLLKRFGTVVWLEAEETTLFERASRKGNRPLLQTENPRKAFSQMLEARRPLYAKIADICVDSSMLTHQEVVDAILSKMEEFASPTPGSPPQLQHND